MVRVLGVVGNKIRFQVFFIWQAIVRGQSVSTEGPFLFLVAFNLFTIKIREETRIIIFNSSIQAGNR